MLVKPSILFNGQAEQAIFFYQRIFNGEIHNLVRFGDTPQNPQFANLEEKDKNRLLNARLNFGNNQFNVSDCFPNQKLNIGNNIMLDVVFFDENEIGEIFNNLSEEGEIIMPLTKVFFSPNYGKIIDKFGIVWNVMQM